MAADKSKEELILLYSPTWAIAATCLVFILVSIFFEQALEYAEHLLLKYKQTSLQAAFDKIKAELLLVGFISIALTVGQSTVEKICIPTKAAKVMPLCKLDAGMTPLDPKNYCSQDHIPLIPSKGFHELHIFIFILAVVHIAYSLLTMALGMWTVNYWKAWEKRARPFEEMSTHGDIRLTSETTFVRSRIPIKWMTKPFIAYTVAFFHQFRNSVTEIDYLTLRHGFIQNHTPRYVDFDFHKYIMRSLQDDFQHVVGISPIMWLCAIAWILFNIDGWETNMTTTFGCLAIILVIGTKMQFIITRMAVRFSKKHRVVEGVASVDPSDDLFWFNRPHFTRWCIHLALFMNALDLSFVLFTKYKYPGDNCVNHNNYWLIGRLFVGILTQTICGLVTLPTYALVSQMGSQLKRTIFEKDIQLALSKWHKQAKESAHHRKDHGGDMSNSHHSSVEISHP